MQCNILFSLSEYTISEFFGKSVYLYNFDPYNMIMQIC